MAERIAYRILGGIVQRDKTRDLAIRNIEIISSVVIANRSVENQRSKVTFFWDLLTPL